MRQIGVPSGQYLTWAKEAKILDLSDDPAKFATDKFMPSA
jgi:hypothetical protein